MGTTKALLLSVLSFLNEDMPTINLGYGRHYYTFRYKQMEPVDSIDQGYKIGLTYNGKTTYFYESTLVETKRKVEDFINKL